MKIYASPNLTIVGHMKNILESNQIPCDIRNQFLGAIIGEIPPIQTWPELWIQDDTQAQHAIQLVQEFIEPTQIERTSWTCPGCNETIEGQFTVCWNCATERTEKTQT